MSWIKLYRDLLDSDIWKSNEPFTYRSAFIHVLLSANWKDGTFTQQGHIVKVKRGQWLTSICKLADIFHWDRKKVYKWLKYMDAAGMITSKSYNFGTTLTVVNYDKFQDDGSAPTTTPTTTVTPTVTTTPTPAPTTTVTPTVTTTPTPAPTPAPTTQYKNIEYRREKEECVSAPSERPAFGKDSEDDDDDGMTLEEARRYWESLQ